MKVRMKVDISGDRNGRPWPRRGGVIDLPDAEAAALCAMGGAEPVADDDVEKAVPAGPETPESADDAEKAVPDGGEERGALTAESAAPVAKKTAGRRAPRKRTT